MTAAIDAVLYRQAATEIEKSEEALIQEAEAALLLLKSVVTRLTTHRRNFGQYLNPAVDVDFGLVDAVLLQCNYLLTKDG
jgi:hypothetical protein